MRVISGTARGKKLKSPQDERVRPTLDRVKENLFNMIGLGIRGAVVLDAFAGSGGLGIEALSRGAAKCYFVDLNKKSIALTKENLKDSRLEENAVVLHMDAMDAIPKLFAQNIRVDYLFLDPPYNKGIVEKILQQLEKYNIMQEDGTIIIETDRDEKLEDEIHQLVKIKEKQYSSTRITIYQSKIGALHE